MEKQTLRWTVRDLVYIGLFGALWGAMEMTLGDVLHAIRLPFSGTVLTALGIAIALVGRRFIPKRGSVFMIALVAGLLKFLSPSGMSVLRVFISIVIEGTIAEAVVNLLPPRRATWLLADALATLWTLFHPVLISGLLLGAGAVEMFVVTVERGARTLGMSPDSVIVVLALVALINLAVGALGGWLSWEVGGIVEQRLHPAEED
ncbi:MAG TPA: hypothetical protein ENN14_01935 [Chloroflexi bacterium]|nr:hypothetical protein [Chloroflexota bacterium]